MDDSPISNEFALGLTVGLMLGRDKGGGLAEIPLIPPLPAEKDR